MPRIKKQTLKRRADGRYCCKYHGIQFMGNTSDEALAAREAYKRREKAGEFSQDNMPFSTYAMKWLAAYKAHLTTGPYNTHVRMINRFTLHAGDPRLRDVTPSDISRFYQTFAGKSVSQIHSARDTIKGVFRAALADGLIEKDPAAFVDIPKGTKGSHREITAEERQLILDVQHRMRLPVLVMLYAGLRRGEVMALHADRDVDLDAKTITVREAVRFDTSGKPVIVDPKTEAGARTIPLLDGLADELRGRHGLICVSADGQMMTESAWKRAWQSYLYALGVRRNGSARRRVGDWAPVQIRAHDLRHSYCTMLYNSGVDLKTAMTWMGHADQTMTLRIYTHLSDTRKKEAENALREAQKNAFRMQNGMQSENDPHET